MRANEIRMWQIGREVGRNEVTICRWFREPLVGEQKELVESAIDKLIKEANKNE